MILCVSQQHTFYKIHINLHSCLCPPDEKQVIISCFWFSFSPGGNIWLLTRMMLKYFVVEELQSRVGSSDPFTHYSKKSEPLIMRKISISAA